ncbi:MAG: hypothetical protein ABIC40_02575, partial [bacterium]
LVGAGVKPVGTFKVGSSLVTRTPPILMIYYGAVVKIYRGSVDRPLDGVDLPKLCWWLNFIGVLPWALILFFALIRLGKIFGAEKGTAPIWAAWAGMAGTLVFGWFGTVNEWLPTAALSMWCVALVIEGKRNPRAFAFVLAGIAGGLAGLFNPSGWLWAVWAIFYLLVSPTDSDDSSQARFVTYFTLSALAGVILSAVGGFFFYGKPLPVQWIDLQPITMDTGALLRLLWHDLIGLNGIIWLAPLTIPGFFALVKSRDSLHEAGLLKFLIGLIVLVFLVLAIGDDARVISEDHRVPAALRLVPVELVDGNFAIVNMGKQEGTEKEYQAYLEAMFRRTDLFYWQCGRSPGLPMFLTASILLGMIGWCGLAGRRFWANWNWLGVRFGGMIGLVMSQAAYGGSVEMARYMGALAGNGSIPIAEALISVSIKLAELWPSGVVRF